MCEAHRRLLAECQARREERRARREAIALDCATRLYRARESLHKAREIFQREWEAMLQRVRGLRGEGADA